MSLIERMEAIQRAEERESLRRRRAEEQDQKKDRAREKRIRRRYKDLLPLALEQQAELFEELRSLGVIPLIEEVAFSINPIQTNQKSKEQSINLGETKSPIKKEIHEAIIKEWMPHVLFPDTNDDGTPNSTLNILLVRTDYHKPVVKSSDRPKYHVLLSYSPDRILKIRGAEVNYDKHLQLYDPLIQLPPIEHALAKSLLHPARVL